MSAPPPRTRDALPLGEAFALFFVTFALLALVAEPLSGLGLTGLAIAQIFVIGGVTLCFCLVRYRGGATRVLGLATPRGTSLLGASLVGASFWILLAVLVLPLVEPLVDQDQAVRDLQREFLATGDPLWVRLVVLSAAPAVCEELLFRGALARALVPRLGLSGAAVVSALLFGAFHLSPARFAPTAVLGLVLAYAALGSGSLWPAVVIHFVNNAIALDLASGGGLPGAAEALEQHPWGSALAAASLTATGFWLLRPLGPPGPPGPPPGGTPEDNAW